jgi:hypothetical protein
MTVCTTLVCTEVDRISISMDALRLRNEVLSAALGAWEADDTPFSEQELDTASRAVGAMLCVAQQERHTTGVVDGHLCRV